MPQLPHELPVALIRDDPEALPELLSAVFDVRLPKFASVQARDAKLTLTAPVEYCADQVVLGYADPADKQPVHAVIFESQSRQDERKLFTWPLYVAGLRAQYECGATLVVFCADEQTERWAAEPIDMGHPSWDFRPLVLGPSRMPPITDPARATRYPALGILSALHHAGDSEYGDDVFRAAVVGLDTLDEERARFYMDGLFTVLDEAVARHLVKLMEADVTMTTYHSKYARTYYDAGEANGEAKGKAEDLLMVLDERGFEVSEETRRTIAACSDIDQLRKWIRQAVKAPKIEDVFV